MLARVRLRGKAQGGWAKKYGGQGSKDTRPFGPFRRMQGMINFCSEDDPGLSNVSPSALEHVNLTLVRGCGWVGKPKVAKSSMLTDQWIPGHFVLGSHARQDKNLFRR